MKTLPKSLHTVTVLVRVTRTLAAHGGLKPSYLILMSAVSALGLSDTSDDYGLIDAAARQLGVQP